VVAAGTTSKIEVSIIKEVLVEVCCHGCGSWNNRNGTHI
jgi:hypothetical protein